MDNFEYIERLPSEDADWSDDDWRILISYLVDNGLVSYMEIASLLLGHLNPPQVGTSVASNKSF